MDYKQRYILTLCIAVFCLACTSLRGQTYPYVYSLSIYPPNPTENDTVKLIATDIFAVCCYQPVTKSVSFSGNSIKVDAYYCTPTIVLNVISPITDTIVIGLLAPGTYNLNYTLATSVDSACIAFMPNDTASISFIVTPVASQCIADAGSDTMICNADSVALGGAPTAIGGTPPYVYSWSPGLTLDDSTVANPVTLAYVPGTDYILTVTDSAGNTCTDSVYIEGTSWSVSSVVPDTTICKGDTAIIFSILSSAMTPMAYLWDPDSTLSDPTIETPNAFPSYTTTYTVLITDAAGCQDSTYYTVFVDSCSGIAPVANFICSDDTANACCFNFTDLSTGNPNSWLWSFPGASPSSSALQNPATICYTTSGAYDVTLQVSNGSGGDSITRSGVITVGFAGCTCSDTTSTELNQISDVYHDLLSLYPNPMVDIAILYTKAALLNSKLDLSFVLYDVLGREVRNLEIEHPQTPINRGDLEQGLYFYQVNNGNSVLKAGKILME